MLVRLALAILTFCGRPGGRTFVRADLKRAAFDSLSFWAFADVLFRCFRIFVL
jgi:hypothetical protein